MKDRLTSLPSSLQIETTKQRIYRYVKDNPGSLNKDVSKAVGVNDAGEPLRELEVNGFLRHENTKCCNAKTWFVK